jgi:hypothetical protein
LLRVAPSQDALRNCIVIARAKHVLPLLWFASCFGFSALAVRNDVLLRCCFRFVRHCEGVSPKQSRHCTLFYCHYSLFLVCFGLHPRKTLYVIASLLRGQNMFCPYSGLLPASRFGIIPSCFAFAMAKQEF